MAPPKRTSRDLGMGTTRTVGRVSLAVLMALVVFATFTFVSTNESHAASCETAPSTCLRWNTKYDGQNPSLNPNRPGFSDDFADDMDAGGGRVYVTGRSFGNPSLAEHATVAYDGATGTQLWVAEESVNVLTFYDPSIGPSIVYNGPKSLVIVTREVFVDQSGRQYETVAYGAATGTVKWRAHQCGGAAPGADPEGCPDSSTTDVPRDIDVSPDGEIVVVTGQSERHAGSTGYDYLTIAYDANDGREVWRKTFNGLANGFDFGRALDVTADRVFVTGLTRNQCCGAGGASIHDWGTVAYRLSNGDQLWATEAGLPNDTDIPHDIEASGGRVFVTGEMNGAIATASYDAASGTQEWRHIFQPGITPADEAGIRRGRLAVNPAGTHLYVTGTSGHPQRGSEITTLRYPVAGSTPTATAVYENGAGDDVARDIVVGTEDGQTRVFVTGELARSSDNQDIVVLGYDNNLDIRWDRVRGGASNDEARKVALNSPNDLDSVFSAGSVHSPGTNYDYDTAAYDASVQPDPTPPASASASATPSRTPTPTPTASQRTPTPTPRPTVTTTPSGSPSPRPTPTTTPTPRPECSDSIDNDADDRVDLEDPDCTGSSDDNESPETCADAAPGSTTPRPGGGMLIAGTSGNDRLVGTAGDDLICGFDGGDTITGLGGNDRIRAGRGVDTVGGGAGQDRMFGGRGADDLRGNGGSDIIRGRVGNDKVVGGGDADQVWGGGGHDRVLGNRSEDDLFGGHGNDSLDGGRGVDTCVPGPGRDRQRSC